MSTFTFTGTVDTKGRITIPSSLRSRLGLKPSDVIELAVTPDRIDRYEVGSLQEAREILEQYQQVESFSYEAGVLEVVADA